MDEKQIEDGEIDQNHIVEGVEKVIEEPIVKDEEVPLKDNKSNPLKDKLTGAVLEGFVKVLAEQCIKRSLRLEDGGLCLERDKDTGVFVSKPVPKLLERSTNEELLEETKKRIINKTLIFAEWMDFASETFKGLGGNPKSLIDLKEGLEGKKPGDPEAPKIIKKCMDDLFADTIKVGEGKERFTIRLVNMDQKKFEDSCDGVESEVHPFSKAKSLIDDDEEEESEEDEKDEIIHDLHTCNECLMELLISQIRATENNSIVLRGIFNSTLPKPNK